MIQDCYTSPVQAKPETQSLYRDVRESQLHRPLDDHDLKTMRAEEANDIKERTLVIPVLSSLIDDLHAKMLVE